MKLYTFLAIVILVLSLLVGIASSDNPRPLRRRELLLEIVDMVDTDYSMSYASSKSSGKGKGGSRKGKGGSYPSWSDDRRLFGRRRDEPGETDSYDIEVTMSYALGKGGRSGKGGKAGSSKSSSSKSGSGEVCAIHLLCLLVFLCLS